MESFIPQLIVILLVGILAGATCRLCRIPILPGYVLAGAIISPSAFHLIGPGNQIESLAEIGFFFYCSGSALSCPWKNCVIPGESS
ncbi:MAG: cation:proton antiporter [Thermogutta sp.]